MRVRFPFFLAAGFLSLAASSSGAFPQDQPSEAAAAAPAEEAPQPPALDPYAPSPPKASPELQAPPEPEAPSRAPVERIDEHRMRVGTILIDRREGELRVDGTVNSVTVLEYLANARGGYKAYESALELDCSAIEFNTALILLGLDPDHGVPSEQKFDPEPPRGDLVEVWVEWQAGGETVRRRGEEMLFDTRAGKALAPGPWVYTGSVLYPDGTYLAALDGVLIGFMHTPESIIDSPRPLQSDWGDVQINPELGIEKGTPVTVVVRRLAGSGSG